MATLKLDPHVINNRGNRVDTEVQRVIQEAIERRISTLEIIPETGSGQLKMRGIRFLQQKRTGALYHRIDKDSNHHRRLFVYLRY